MIKHCQLHYLHLCIYIYRPLQPTSKLKIEFIVFYIYIHLYTSIYIYIHLYTSIYIYIHLYTSIYIYMHLYTSIYIYNLYIYIHHNNKLVSFTDLKTSAILGQFPLTRPMPGARHRAFPHGPGRKQTRFIWERSRTGSLDALSKFVGAIHESTIEY